MVLQHTGPPVQSLHKKGEVYQAERNTSRAGKIPWVNIGKKSGSDVKKFKCVYSNVDTLLNKRHELGQLIQDQSPSILCFTEILPKNKLKVLHSEFSLPGYNLFTNIENPNCHRGIAIYVENSISCSAITFPYDLKEFLICELKLNNLDFYLCTLYRSPNSTEANNNSLNQFLLDISKKYKNLIICGDFNYPSIDWSSNSSPKSGCTKSEKFLESARESYSYQHVFQPTHYRALQNPTTIDLVFTSEPNMLTQLSFSAPLGKSHHQILSFNFFSSSKNIKKPQTKYLYKKADYNKIKTYFNNNFSLQLERMDSQKAFEFFASKMELLVTNHVPKITIKPSKHTPWLNDQTKEKLRAKQTIYRRFL